MAQLNHRIGLRPVDCIIIRDIALNCDLRAQLEANLAALDTLIELVEQVVVVFLLDGLGVECLHACIWRNDVADESLLASTIDKLERGDAKVLLRRKALRRWLRVCDKRQSRGMTSQEVTYRAGPEALQKLEELSAGASRERRNGMADDIGVLAIAELESDTDASWVGVAVCVGDLGNSRGVGEANPDGSAGGSKVRGNGEPAGFGSGYKCSTQKLAFGVS